MSFSQFKEVIEEGDTVILYIGVSQIYAIEVKPTVISKLGQPVINVFQTKYGSLRVMDLVGVKFGARINLSRGWAHVLNPTPELWTVTLPHRTQILYTPDISMVLSELEVGPGSVVCEAGTGSGSLSHAFLRAIGPTGKLYTCDFHKERVKVAAEEFELHGYKDRVSVTHLDVCVDGLGVTGLADAVFLDLPKPWEALPHALKAVKMAGGRVCSFSPCIEQVSRSCETMRDLGMREISTLECLTREFQVKNINMPVITCERKIVEPQINRLEVGDPQKIKRIKVENESTKSANDDDNNSPSNLISNVNAETEEITEAEMESSKEENYGNVVRRRKKGKNTQNGGEEMANPEVRFLIAMTPIKMPGHTGFLTFATVPPGLKRVSDYSESVNEKNASESEKNVDDSTMNEDTLAKNESKLTKNDSESARNETESMMNEAESTVA